MSAVGGVASTDVRTTATTRSAGLRPALLGWVAARVAVAVGFVVAHLLSGHVTLPDGRLHLREGLLTWDGTFYRLLAERGYSGAPPEADRFFPLFPALGRAAGGLLAGRADLGLLVVSNLAALAAAVVLWHLVIDTLDDRGAADRSAWMVALWPASFVLAMAYTESILVLAVAATLLALQRRSFALAGAAAAAAAMVRPTGVLLVVPVAVEAWRSWRHDDAESPWPPPRLGAVVVGLLGPVLGLGAALGIVGRSSDDGWRGPFDVQRQLRGGFREPVTRLVHGVVDVGRGDLRYAPSVVLAVVAVGLVVVGARRLPRSWTAYSVVTLAVALASPNIDSLGRYLLGAVPIVVAAAVWADRRWRAALVATLGALGVVGCTAAALLGRMVP